MPFESGSVTCSSSTILHSVYDTVLGKDLNSTSFVLKSGCNPTDFGADLTLKSDVVSWQRFPT